MPVQRRTVLTGLPAGVVGTSLPTRSRPCVTEDEVVDAFTVGRLADGRKQVVPRA